MFKILKKTTQDVEVNKFCISLLEASGSLKYTKKTMADLDKAICSEVDRLGGKTVHNNLIQQTNKQWETGYVLNL